MAALDIATRRLTVLCQIAGALGDLRGFVADAFQIDNDLADADHQAQIAGRRLTPRQDAQTFLVDVQLHLVDGVILLAHLLRQLGIALDQGNDGVIDLFLDQTAHLQQLGANFLEFVVELLGNVLIEQFFI